MQKRFTGVAVDPDNGGENIFQSILYIRTLTSYRATLFDIYQLASKMRLYRSLSANRANLHNLVRLESPRPFLPFLHFIPLPRTIVDPS